MDALIRLLDRLTEAIGRFFSWLILVMVVIMFANVVLRYAFGIVDTQMYQAVNWSFGMVLTACAGYALLHDDHVRVDVFYGAASDRKKAVVNLVGGIVLLAPFLYVLWERVFPYVRRSWILREGAQELSGIQAVYLLKSFILVFVIVLGIQGLSVILKSIRTITVDARTSGKHDRGGLGG